LQDDASKTFYFTLNPDRTVTFPPGEEVERDSRVRWKFAAGEQGSTSGNEVITMSHI